MLPNWTRREALMGAGTLALLKPTFALAAPLRTGEPAMTLVRLREMARETRTPRVSLLPETAEPLRGHLSLESDADRVPNYLRAFGAVPGAAKPFAELVRAVFFQGSVPTAVKLAAALRIAQLDGSPYVAAHLERLLRACGESGAGLLRAVEKGQFSGLAPEERAALNHADALGRGPRNLNDDAFRALRPHFNDAQLVELTVNVCFTSYFTRFCEGLNLPAEPWLSSTRPTLPTATEAPGARIGLISDAEYEAFREVAERAKAGDGAAKSLGLGIANSQRAMAQAPEASRAWFGYWAKVREAQEVDRTTKLQVSFAVSMQNGCRYCTVHQVVGLRRQGVDMAKLTAMQKDDSALTPKEKAAVVFARNLTKQPVVATDAGYRSLEPSFGKQGAFEVLLQTCAFNYMNRFTDGLRLPSEDEAVKTYQEVYGPGSYEGYHKRKG